MYSPTFQSGPTRIIGPVWTVKFVPKSDVEAPKIKGHYVRLHFPSPAISKGDEMQNFYEPCLW
jgi:hypothetical protein